MAEDCVRPWANPRPVVDSGTGSVSVIPSTLRISGPVEKAWEPFSEVMLFRKKTVTSANGTWWHTRRNQIRSSSETDESIYIGGGFSSVENWLSWSEGRRRTIVVTLDGLFRVRMKPAWLPTPFVSFPFTSPPVRRRVPPDSVSTLPFSLASFPFICIFIFFFFVVFIIFFLYLSLLHFLLHCFIFRLVPQPAVVFLQETCPLFSCTVWLLLCCITEW